MRHWVIYAIIPIVAAGIGAGVALYFAYTNQVEFVAGETRSELLSLNAPPGTLTTEDNAAYKAPAAPAPAAGTAPGPTPTTRMLCLASSTPAVRVSMRMPPLERQ